MSNIIGFSKAVFGKEKNFYVKSGNGLFPGIIRDGCS